MEKQTLYVISGVLLIFLVLAIVPWGGSCSEKYKPDNDAQFQVKRPKYVVPEVHPMKRPAPMTASAPGMKRTKEGYLWPPPSATPMLASAGFTNAGFNSNTANPFVGFPVGSLTYGPSTPVNPNLLLSGNSSTEAINVYKTVI